MSIHESGINYHNLIRDLAEMYPVDVAEVVLVELVANSLDAGATHIDINFDPKNKNLVLSDNGKGMNNADFEKYHDFAAGLKTRGTGIGFAGVGAKISFNIADRVITETRSATYSAGSNWYLQSRNKLVWEDIEPIHLQHYGTRVQVIFNPNSRLPYSNTSDIVKILKSNYLPLFDLGFLSLYEKLGRYSSILRFTVNGNEIKPTRLIDSLELSNVKEFYPLKASKRIGYGLLGLSPTEYLLGDDLCGILLCTCGKVIKADLFNQFPGNLGPRILGLVEIPGFIDFLTTSKTDFMRRKRLREFETLYNPIRQEFKTWLKTIGVEPNEISDREEEIKLEKELKKILEDIPQLSELFGFRTKTDVPKPDNSGEISINQQEGVQPTFPIGDGKSAGENGILESGDDPGVAPIESDNGSERAKPIGRTAHRGPKVAFADAPERPDLAWIDGSNVVINRAHHAYIKVKTDTNARKVHSLFAIATAIQRFLAIDNDTNNLMFIDNMMDSWGRK